MTLVVNVEMMIHGVFLDGRYESGKVECCQCEVLPLCRSKGATRWRLRQRPRLLLVARFSDTRTAAAPIDVAWDTLQSPEVWGGLLGASKIADIELEDDGRLRSCQWTAKIGGSDLHGSFKVSESQVHELMKTRIKAEEWKGSIEVKLDEKAEDETVIHARLELQADGFTAMLALPVVSMVVGSHFPTRLDQLVERIEEA